jgi:hypothetical protein
MAGREQPLGAAASRGCPALRPAGHPLAVPRHERRVRLGSAATLLSPLREVEGKPREDGCNGDACQPETPAVLRAEDALTDEIQEGQECEPGDESK